MFILNGIIWYICFVNYDNPILYDHYNHVLSVATTDNYSHTIYISDIVDDKFLFKILKHELYHCFEFSNIAYNLPTFYEELVADFIATYGEDLINIAYDIFNEITYY